MSAPSDWSTLRRQVALLLLFLHVAANAPEKRGNWDILSFHVSTTVTCRYAVTVITSEVANQNENSTEIDFHVKIPKKAFISKFRMTIDGQIYDGVVKPKEEAKQEYTQAASQGRSAALISAAGRTLEDFKTSVSVAAHSKVTFELTYEELLQRRLGKYELLINAQPGQPVNDFKINISLHEKPGINLLEVEGSLASKDLASALTKSHVDQKAWVNFHPTRDQQMRCDGCGEKGLSGDLKIIFDVERPHSKGDLREYGGFFVHYFAPTGLPRIPKNVVFIIDQSSSMAGEKIRQTRVALLKILDDLAEDDHFGLICFDDKITPWKRELLRATQQNLEQAKEFVRTITDRGSTDINAAVLEGVKMIKKNHKEGSASILILLTDGDPTSGETSMARIRSNVREAIWKKFPLYCLGFGFDVKFEFLQKMAQENSGVARRIYEDSDADLQLKGFYEEVAVPLLINVQMNYSGATHLTQTNFSHYYNGSEIVVAGQITDISGFSTEVKATSTDSKVMYVDIKPIEDDKLPTAMSGFENFLQRLWACLTVKQLLEKELMLNGEEKEAVRKEALDLSLKYSFVTPLTSMVVTKPEGEDSQVADKPKEGQRRHPARSRFLYNADEEDWEGFRSFSTFVPQDADEEDSEGYSAIFENFYSFVPHAALVDAHAGLPVKGKREKREKEKKTEKDAGFIARDDVSNHVFSYSISRPARNFLMDGLSVLNLYTNGIVLLLCGLMVSAVCLFLGLLLCPLLGFKDSDVMDPVNKKDTWDKAAVCQGTTNAMHSPEDTTPWTPKTD